MAAPAATKPAKQVNPADLKKEKVKRVDFVRSPEAKALLDGQGRLAQVPGSTFDTKKHLAPKKGDFASEPLFMNFKADRMEVAAQDMIKGAAHIRKEAIALKDAPDPAVRAQVKRVQRLKDQLAALTEQLNKEGIKI